MKSDKPALLWYNRRMTKRELIDLCLSWPDTHEAYPFDMLTAAPDSWAVIRHNGTTKSFACITLYKGRLIVNLKCNPIEADMLRQMFSDVIPGYHMNKEHWNTVFMGGDVPTEALHAMIDKSYHLTKPKRQKNG